MKSNKRRGEWFLAMLIAVALLGQRLHCPASPAPAGGTPGPSVARVDRILVKPKSKLEIQALTRLHGTIRSQVLRTFPEIGNLQILSVPKGKAVADLIAAYTASGLVAYAEPDYMLESFIDPNDPRFLDGTLWNLHNTGLPGADIHAPEGWDIQDTATNVLVAVIDSGIRHSHEDLAANLWLNPGETGLDASGHDKSSNGIDDDGDGYVDDVYGIDAIAHTGQPMDILGHGSHVSGIIGALGNNGVGVVGVAWRIRMMDCKFLNMLGEGAGSISDAITCIDYARSKGAKIINASWGGRTFASAALYDAVKSTHDAGIIFVAATGNNGGDNDISPLYPASYPFDNIIAVMATTRTDQKASWSNFGANSVDIGAPGEDIFSCWYDADDNYQSVSGTSMATAHVSGVCAVVWAHSPTESYRQIINRVLSSADPLPSLAGKCLTGGRVNLQKALVAPLHPLLTVTQSSNRFQLTVQGATNTGYALDFSTNLPGWIPLVTNRTGIDGKFTLMETNTGTLRKKFWRARL